MCIYLFLSPCITRIQRGEIKDFFTINSCVVDESIVLGPFLFLFSIPTMRFATGSLPHLMPFLLIRTDQSCGGWKPPQNRFYFLNLSIAQFLVTLRKNSDVTIFFFSQYQYPNLFIGTCYLFPSISFHRDRGKSVAHHDITPAMRIVCGLSLFFPRVYEFFFFFL